MLASKNKSKLTWFIVICALIDNEYASLLFFQIFFSYCFCMLSEFAKVFEKKVLLQEAHVHTFTSLRQGAKKDGCFRRPLSCPSRCFQLSTNLNKDFFCYLWFSVICTLIDNDTRHRSGQNLLWTHSAAEI